MHVLTAFIYLQLLDILTTVAFMMYGVSELNPFVKWAMRESTNPLGGLLLIKGVAVLLALLCVARARHGVLRKVNWMFGLIVAYNIVALILAAPVLQ